MRVIDRIASACDALTRCNLGWRRKWIATLQSIERKHLPHGCGIDAGASIDYAESTLDRVVIVSSFHVMNEVGFYTHWVEFTVTITPAFSGINIDIQGLGDDEDQLLDYLHDTFYCSLTTELSE